MSLNSINAALGLGLDLSDVTTPDHTADEIELLTLIVLSRNASMTPATWGTITGSLSAQGDLQAALDLLAPLASPEFTGIVTIAQQLTSPGNMSLNPVGVVLLTKDTLSAAGTYHNWGGTAGTGGYGLREVGGEMQFKNSGGAWAAIGGAAGATVAWGQITGTLSAQVDLLAALSDLQLSIDGLETAVNLKAAKSLTINNQTDSYTLVLGDADNYVRISKATACNLTVPLNATVAFPIGAQIPIRQVGIGQLTVVATGGVTINTSQTLKLLKQNSTAALIKVATDTWDLTGELEAAP